MEKSSSSETDSALRKLVSSGSFTFGGNLIEMAISFVAIILVGRYLSVANFGSINIALKILTVSFVFSALGMGSAIQRFVPRASTATGRRSVFVSAYHILIVASLIMGVAVFVSAGLLADQVFNDETLKPVLQIIAFAIPANVLLRHTGSIRALERVGPEIIVKSIVWPISRIALIVGAVIISGGILEIAGAYTISYWIGGLLGFAVVAYYTPLLDFSTSWQPKYRKLLTYSIPLMAGGMMSFIMTWADVFMLGYFSSSAEVGLYTAGYTLGSTINLTLGSLSALFLPLFSGMHAEGNFERMQTVYRLVSKWAAFVSLPVLMTLVLFPHRILSMTFGEKYAAGAAMIVIVVGFTYFIRTIMGPNNKALEAIGATKAVMWGNIIAATLNIATNILLIPKYGALGAAIATLVSFTSLNIVYSGVLYMKNGIHPFSFRTYIPMIGYAIVLTMIAMGSRAIIVDKRLMIGVYLIIGGIVYPFVIALTNGFEREDIMLVNALENKLGVDLGHLKNIVSRFIL